ncbi:hypothetical protein [Saccharopolyspora phatthalungensis]|uniref:Uncharacterized protein n=1 Tax=Saccharopolyspora phatthalungensis TaxID=664693 RepID=A0A840QJQ9_9PSEU|nr:hypothetical protein [Saccharopolyspora phatthalungensis]MBB5159265.1 hypothetical protein [Saccharopolyspora phatthalungensis]
MLLRDLVLSGRARPGMVVTHHGGLDNAPGLFRAFDRLASTPRTCEHAGSVGLGAARGPITSVRIVPKTANPTRCSVSDSRSSAGW